MKQKGFIEQVRQSANANRIWTAPGQRIRRNWPLCLTCGADVDSVELANANQLSVEIVAKCRHISKTASDEEYERTKPFEDYYRVVFPFRIEGDPLKDDRANWAVNRAMGDFCAFDPNAVPK